MEPIFYLIGGPARVGKTTVGRALPSRLGIGWLSVDALRDVLYPAGVRFGADSTVEGAQAQARGNLLPAKLQCTR